VNAHTLLGAVMIGALVFYALFAGADYGGGVWDILAGGARAKKQRAHIENAIGPIWEANHVWLILVVVVLFTGFPPAFGALATRMFVPVHVLLIGIVLRGAAFTFRHYDSREDRVQRRWGLVFSTSSVIAPIMLGIVVGCVSSSRHWRSAFPFAVGLFAVALFSFIAAAYLAAEAEGELREDFRRRALGAGAAVGALALVVFALSWTEAPLIRRGLTERPWSWPLHAATGAAAVLAFWALWVRRHRLARAAAAAQVALIVLGWGASQYPFLIVPDVTLSNASAPRATQVMLLWALAAGSVLLFPSLYFLFRIFKGERAFAILEDRPPGRAR